MSVSSIREKVGMDGRRVSAIDEEEARIRGRDREEIV